MVSAALAAGLTFRSLQEFSEPDMYPGLGSTQAPNIPATYLLTAVREPILYWRAPRADPVLVSALNAMSGRLETATMGVCRSTWNFVMRMGAS